MRSYSVYFTLQNIYLYTHKYYINVRENRRGNKKRMKNDLHCITQKTPLTSEGNTVPAQVAGPDVSLLSDTNIICYENCVEGNNQN